MKNKNKVLLNISTFVTFGFIFIGCQTNQEGDQLSQNLRTYEEVWSKFFNERDMDIITSEYFTEDVTVVIPGDDIVGIEGLKNYYGNYLTGFSDAEFTFIDLFGQGDKLVKHWNFKGTHDGNFAGIPATGQKLNLYGTTLILMENGKIKQEHDFYDNLDFLTQLGLME